MRIGVVRRLRGLPFRLRNGFWPSETWNLDATIAEFVLPRLRYHRAHHVGYPGDMTPESWVKAMDEMIWALERTALDDLLDGGPKPGQLHDDWKTKCERHQAGLELFRKHFSALWD